MNLYEYQRSKSFIDLSPRSLRFNIFRFLFLRNCLADWSQVLCGASVGRGTKVWLNGLGHIGSNGLKLYEYQRSKSFIDLGPNHSDSIFLIFFSSITADFNISWALRWAIQDQSSSGWPWQRLKTPLFRHVQLKKILLLKNICYF